LNDGVELRGPSSRQQLGVTAGALDPDEVAGAEVGEAGGG